MDTGEETPAGGMAAAAKVRLSYLHVFGGAFCISFAAFFVKGAGMNSSMIAFYRLLFGSAALMLFAFLGKNRILPSRRMLVPMILAGLFFSTDLLLWHTSIVMIGPGIATIIANFEVLFLAAYGVIFLGERLTWQQKLAVPLGLAGLSLLLGIHEDTLPPGVLAGAGICFASSFFYALYILTLRKTQSVPERLAAIPNMAWVSIAALAGVGVYCAGAGISFSIPDGRTLGILAGLGIVCQSFGWLLLSKGLPNLSPFRAGLILLIQPALSYLWDMLFFDAGADWLNILGAVVAIGAIGLGIFTNPQPAGEAEAAENASPTAAGKGQPKK